MSRFVVVVSLIGGCAPLDGPRVDDLEPGAAARGASVVLYGAGFCGGGASVDGRCEPLPSGAVDFGLSPPIARAELRSWRDGAIDVLVPASVDIGATTVYVTVDGRSSNGVSFEVLP